jgi:hypothetical protein
MNLRLTALALCLASAPAAMWAHHSLAAEFDTKKPIKLTGKMTKLDWRNPHAWIYIDAENIDGKALPKVEKWQCELGSPNAMTRAGFANDSIKVGDEIVLDGSLAKDGSKTCSTRVVSDKAGTTLLRQ